jgi:hypothetical protein
VGEYGRRLTSVETLPADSNKDKLEQKTIDFDKLLENAADDQGLSKGNWDVIFITYVASLWALRIYLLNAAYMLSIDWAQAALPRGVPQRSRRLTESTIWRYTSL